MNPVIGVIQARMGSSRVPGKAMLDLAGKPLLWHMIDRLRRVPQIGPIVLATSSDERNAPMIALAEAEGLSVCRHPGEDDLAGRIARAIRPLAGDLVLRVGGDCPLIDPAVLDGMVALAIDTPGADFVSNRIDWSFPLGLSADVLSRRAIEWCDENLTDAEDRELFAVYVRDHPERFCVRGYVNDVDLSHHGWTVDEPGDVVFMTGIFDALYRPGAVFGMQAVLDHLASRPDRKVMP